MIAERLQVSVDADGHTLFTIDGRPVAILEHARVPQDPKLDGWMLWGATPDAEPTPYDLGWPEPVDVAPGAPRELAEHVAIAMLRDHIERDLQKGIGPFDPDGIAGRARGGGHE